MEADPTQQEQPTLRPMRWPEDEPFLETVYASTREMELLQVPWTAEQKAEFCRMQFVAQHTDYQQNYHGAAFDIIELHGEPIGRLYVDRRPSAIHIIDITLLPAWRNQGIGAEFLRTLHDEASAGGKLLSIHVEKFNPARRLYERLGFQKAEDGEVYLLMEWGAG